MCCSRIGLRDGFGGFEEQRERAALAAPGLGEVRTQLVLRAPFHPMVTLAKTCQA
jgi:hypothetical protein